MYSNTVLISQTNQGLSAARNSGMREAKGDYLFFLDSDDYIDVNILEKIVNISSRLNLDMALGQGLVEFDDNNKREIISELKCINIKERLIYSGMDFLKEQLKHGTFQTVVWLYVYKKNFIKQNNFQFKEGFLHEDEAWTPMVILKAKTIMYINEVLYIYRKRKESITTKQKSSKNFIDLSIIRKELKDYYSSNIDDTELKKLLLNDLVKRRLYDYAICKKYNAKNEKDFFKSYSGSLSNRVKSKILIYIPGLYFHFFDFIHRRSY